MPQTNNTRQRSQQTTSEAHHSSTRVQVETHSYSQVKPNTTKSPQKRTFLLVKSKVTKAKRINDEAKQPDSPPTTLLFSKLLFSENFTAARQSDDEKQSNH